MPFVPFHRSFDHKVRNFPENTYPLSKHDHLTKLLRVLLEDAGVGQLFKFHTIARIQFYLRQAHFSELESYFGSALHFPRLPEEMYSADPYNDQLTSDQWRSIENKDAAYRDRLRMLLSAMMLGGTVDGLSMASEAASGVPCHIIEVWRYTDNAGATEPGRLGNSPKEFVVIPSDPDISYARIRAIYNTINRLKPANTVLTVDPLGVAVRSVISIRHITSPSEYFEIRKYVTGVNPPSAPPSDRYFWIEDGVEVEAPSFAHLTTMESEWSLNNSIVTVDAFEIGSDFAEHRLTSAVSPGSDEWGPWRDIEVVDSPDNYPQGKYPSDSSKYDSNGDYIFAWSSQSDYVSWLTTTMESIGGEISGSKYRLPMSLEITPGSESSPMDAIATVPLHVQSLYYTQDQRDATGAKRE